MTDEHQEQLTRHAAALEEAARMVVVLSMDNRPYQYDEESLQVVDDYLSKKPNFKLLVSLLLKQ